MTKLISELEEHIKSKVKIQSYNAMKNVSSGIGSMFGKTKKESTREL
jgi:hypothetical protein